MSDHDRNAARTLILLEDGQCAVPPNLFRPNDHVIVAGPSRAGLALAPLSLPGAETIWTDPQHSASVRSLRASLRLRGGIDRLVLVCGQSIGLAGLSSLLGLLPLLRQRHGAELRLCLTRPAAERPLRMFLDQLAPQLQRDRVTVHWSNAMGDALTP